MGLFKKHTLIEGNISIPFKLNGKEYTFDIHFGRNTANVMEVTERTESCVTSETVWHGKLWV